MKGRRSLVVSGFLVLVLALAVGPGQAQEMVTPGDVIASASIGTAFTYQGQLNHEGSPANGEYDFRFGLFDAATGGAQAGDWVNIDNVTVSDGLFAVELDFGDVFDGTPLWLRVSVRPAGVGNYTVLSPRQALTPAPYAIYAAQVGDHDHWGEQWSGSGTGLALSGGDRGLEATGSGVGVYAGATGNSGFGVYAVAPGSEGVGVLGYAPDPSGENIGVHGSTVSSAGKGVYGEAWSTTGTNYGVFGTTRSSDGAGVQGSASATSGVTYGVYGLSESTSGRGVQGSASATSGHTAGVYGWNVSTSGAAVWGHAHSSSGTNYGVRGNTNSDDGYGGYFSGGTGVFGLGSATEGTTYGVRGLSHRTAGVGVFGFATASTGTNYGVRGRTGSDDGYAGYFNGRVHVLGDLSATGSKPFQIDHPLNPAERYLYHFAQEAPEVQNVYNGVVNLDASGAAVVTLPDYFAALNAGPFRYQLTPIGAAMPNLHIAEEIQDNQFEIAGGVPGAKVSWEVTAVRNDPYLRDHRIEAEQDKPTDEQGTYLYPEGYGQPEEMGLDYQRDAHLFDEALEAIEPPRAGNGE